MADYSVVDLLQLLSTADLKSHNEHLTLGPVDGLQNCRSTLCEVFLSWMDISALMCLSTSGHLIIV